MSKLQHNYTKEQAELYSLIGFTGTYKVTFEMLEKICGNLQDKRWMDFGCGPGRSTQFLAKLGAETLGIDKNEEMIRKAKESYPNLNFSFCCSDSVIENEIGLFDGVLSTFVFLEMSSKSTMNEALSFINQHLKPQAPFIMATINPFTVGRSFQSWKHISLRSTLKSGDPIICIINNSSGNLEVTDYYWTIEDYEKVLNQNNFIIEHIYENTRSRSLNNSVVANSVNDENDAWLIIKSIKI